MRRIAIVFITDNGQRLAQRLKAWSTDAEIVQYAPGVVADLWSTCDAFVFIMATGIVVRTIGPLLRDKRTDPAVVVLDEAGRFAVSLAGGHLGGANEMARDIARFLGGEAVITTASDVNGLMSLDLWARDNGLIIEDWDILPQIGTQLINNGTLKIYMQGADGGNQKAGIRLPDEYLSVSDPGSADVLVTNKKRLVFDCPENKQLYVRPKNLVVGIGCNSNTSVDEIGAAVQSTLEEYNLAFPSVDSIATIDIKSNEPGLVAFAKKQGIAILSFTAHELNSVHGVSKSEAVFKATGAVAVAEPAALLAAKADELLVPKQKKGNVTVAVAGKKSGVRSQESGDKNGNIYIVGIGPGSPEHMTPAARDAIRKSDVIVGYRTYLDLIKDLLHDKEVISTGMTQEVERCRKAVDLAISGSVVTVVSSGDPGIYAMAGLVFEILKKLATEDSEGPRIEDEMFEVRNPQSEIRNPKLPPVEVIPGISALNASASLLGAPLMHDFACISLSDRLTPWPIIEKRIEAAAAADFVIVLYNPRSKGRAGHMNRAREIILKHRQTATPVGIVKGAMRDHETVIITDIGNMRDSDIDMQTTVIIGNSKTFSWNNLMITPRGYESKFNI